MSAKVDILAVGYADIISGSTSQGKYMRASGSCCLVRSNKLTVVFDTMGPWERDLLISKLKDFMVHPEDVDYLVCSHSHPDHIGNINLFTKAKKHFIGTSVYTNDIYDLNCFEPTGSYKYRSPKQEIEQEIIEYQNFKLESNLSIEHTPGHTMECISMVVSNCDNLGIVALVGDLFENEKDILDEGIWLAAGSQNPDIQRANRSRILKEVDYILPGHGPLFKTLS